MNNIMIKFILVILLNFFISLSLWSKPYWYKDLEKAKESAFVQKKPILIDFYSETCYYCKIIEKETYNSLEFSKWENKFILTIIDGDKFPEKADEFQIMGYPTIIFLDFNGVEIGRIEGYYPKEKMLEKIYHYYNKKDLYNELTNKIKKDPKNYYYYFQLALYYDKAKQYKQTEENLLKALYYLPMEEKNYFQNKKNILYNLAVINTKQNNFNKAYSYWNAYISWINEEDPDYVIAKYYRSYTLIYKNKKNELNSKELFNQLTHKEKQIVLSDLNYAVKNLPNSIEKEIAKKLLSEIHP